MFKTLSLSLSLSLSLKDSVHAWCGLQSTARESESQACPGPESACTSQPMCEHHVSGQSKTSIDHWFFEWKYKYENGLSLAWGVLLTFHVNYRDTFFHIHMKWLPTNNFLFFLFSFLNKLQIVYHSHFRGHSILTHGFQLPHNLNEKWIVF